MIYQDWTVLCVVCVAVIRVLTYSDCFIWDAVEPFELVLWTASMCFLSSKWVAFKKHVILERGRSLYKWDLIWPHLLHVEWGVIWWWILWDHSGSFLLCIFCHKCLRTCFYEYLLTVCPAGKFIPETGPLLWHVILDWLVILFQRRLCLFIVG
jgi:hypothetical protein